MFARCGVRARNRLPRVCSCHRGVAALAPAINGISVVAAVGSAVQIPVDGLLTFAAGVTDPL